MKKLLSIVLMLSILLSFCAFSYVVGADEENHGPLVYLSTPYTLNAIPAYDNSAVTDYSDALKEEMKNGIALSYPTAEFLELASLKYNCHSYAWYSQDTETNNYWILDVSAYLFDYSYLEIDIDNEVPQSGDVVMYYNHIRGKLVHSAVVDSIDDQGRLIVISKWGDHGLYRHYFYECCYTPYAIGRAYAAPILATDVHYFRAHDHDVTISPLEDSDSEHLVKHKVKCENSGECGVDHLEYHNWEMNYSHSVPGEVEIQARPSYVCSECGLTTPLPPPGYMRSVDEAVTE